MVEVPMTKKQVDELLALWPTYECTCMTMQHDHNVEFYGKSNCPRRATIAGGICNDCRYWDSFPERGDNLG